MKYVYGFECINKRRMRFWKVLFSHIDGLNGCSYNQILFMYSFSLIALTPVNLFDNNWNLQKNVYSGDFIKYCVRPLNSFIFYCLESFSIGGIGQLIIGIILINIASYKLNINYTIITIFLLVFYLFSASLFMLAMHNIAAASCFWLINSGIFLLFVHDFTEFAKYPVTIYNTFFRFLFTFIVPIAFIAYYPSTIFIFEKTSFYAYISPLLGIAFYYMSYKIWMLGAKNYKGTGS